MWPTEKVNRLKQLMADGKTNKEIAREFGCTRAAISRYITRMYANPNHNHYYGCDEDCEHCKYTDCLKPSYLF